jgi:hypothetical protein
MNATSKMLADSGFSFCATVNIVAYANQLNASLYNL